MVIFQIHVVGVASLEPKGDAPVGPNSHVQDPFARECSQRVQHRTAANGPLDRLSSRDGGTLAGFRYSQIRGGEGLTYLAVKFPSIFLPSRKATTNFPEIDFRPPLHP